MNKYVKSFFIIVLAVCMLIPCITVSAQESDDPADWQDITLSQDEILSIVAENESFAVQPLTTGLIVSYLLTIKRDGSNLIIVGGTYGSAAVVKCGFKKVVIQRRQKGTTDWSDYLTYKNLYSDSTIYTLSKTIAISNSYEYRVTGAHYAKKNIFSTETLNNISNTV